MPTILLAYGWRLFFYANEGNEPIHVHAQNGDKEFKFWLDVELFDIREAFAFDISARDRRIVRKIIFNHFDYIVEAWSRFQESKK